MKNDADMASSLICRLPYAITSLHTLTISHHHITTHFCIIPTQFPRRLTPLNDRGELPVHRSSEVTGHPVGAAGDPVEYRDPPLTPSLEPAGHGCCGLDWQPPALLTTAGPGITVATATL